MAAFRIFRRLRELLDVTISTPTDGQVLTYSTADGKWENADATGGGGGATALIDLTDVTGTPGTGKAPVSDGAAGFPLTDIATQAELDAEASTRASGDTAAVATAQGYADSVVAALQAEAVILAPASSSRNIIQPTAGDVIAAVIKANASQSVDLTRWTKSDDTLLAALSEIGALNLKPFDDTSGFAGLLLEQTVRLGAYTFGTESRSAALLVEAVLPSRTVDEAFSGTYSAGTIQLVSSTDTHLAPVLIGMDQFALWNGRKAAGSGQQVAGLYGGRFSAFDHDYGTGAVAGTGDIGQMRGAELYVSHAGTGHVASLIGAYVYAEVQQLATVVPGQVTEMYGMIIDIENDGSMAAPLSLYYGLDFLRTDWANPAITKAAAIHVPNWGQSGTVTSYGILIEDQSGATTFYAIKTGAGRVLFGDTVILGRATVPADADLAASQGAWWVSSGLPVWKGKNGSSAVKTLTPFDTANIDTDGTLAANSDTKVASQKAVKTYAQPLDGTLTALAALTIAANKLVYGTGADAFALTDLSAFARTFLDDADAATVRSTLGLGAVAVLAAIAEGNLSFTDITTANATSSQHGLLPKLDGSATKTLLGDGTWGLAPLYATNVQTASYTLVLGDAGKIVEMNVASGNNLTVPPNSSVAFPVGSVVAVHQYGAGQVTVVAGAGVTINSPSAKLKLTGQYSSAALRKRATDEWVLAGDLTA